MIPRAALLPACAALLGLAAGCGAKVAVDRDPTAGSGGDTSTITTTPTTTTTSGTAGAPPVDAGPDALPPPTVAVYVNSGDALFAIDPVAQTFGEVGPFIGCSQVVDIAVDSTGRIFATSTQGLFRIDPADAACTPIASGPKYPNSLAFAPPGTLDPGQEVLVGYLDTTYVRIDTSDGTITPVGALNGGYTSSGDLVVLHDGLAYLTGKGANCGDCLLRVNPTTGGLVQLVGDIGTAKVFGLAFKYGALYGFSQGGDVLLIDTSSGHGKVLDLPGLPPGVTFWGAASSLDSGK